MRSRWSQLFEKSLAAMVAAIEVYNKPDFRYREETFSVLAINAWELALKAYWLRKNGNKVSSLYVYEYGKNKDGSKSKKKTIKLTRSGNPFTHSIDYLVKALVASKELPVAAARNLEALVEIRDSSVHFYNKSHLFSKRLQEVGMGCLKNYVAIAKSWFAFELSEYNFYLMPLSFVSAPSEMEGVVLNNEEANVVNFIDRSDTVGASAEYAVTVNVNVSFVRSKAKDALKVQVVKGDESATKIELTEEQIRDKYPWSYDELTRRCRERYSDFKLVKRYHDLRKAVVGDERFCNRRYLDPGNPKSGKKDFFNANILGYLDKHYTRRA